MGGIHAGNAKRYDVPDGMTGLHNYRWFTTALRADALRVSVFRQEREGAGWRDAGVNPATAREIENAILTRARQLRLNQING